MFRIGKFWKKEKKYDAFEAHIKHTLIQARFLHGMMSREEFKLQTDDINNRRK